MHTLKLFLIIVPILTLYSCKDVSNPVSNDDRMTVLLSSSFEINNHPALTNWSLDKSITDSAFLFSSDVPSVGGKWSLKLFKSDTSVSSVQAQIHLYRSDSLSKYIITYWGKGKGFAGLVLWSSKNRLLQPGASRHFNESNWTQFSDTLISAFRSFDTLRVILGTEPFDLNSVSQFDNIQVLESQP